MRMREGRVTHSRTERFVCAFPSSSALDKLEPCAIDVAGAAWVARGAYTLAPGARRFESYEMSMAAKVGGGGRVGCCP